MNFRKIEEIIAQIFMITATLIVISCLALIIITIFVKGLPALNLDMLTKTPKGGYYIGKEGGILNAILGSIILGIGSAILALLFSLPIAFYLNIYLKKESRLAFIIRFLLDILWGIPSIVYGAFGFTIMIFLGLQASLLAGTITVSLLILPLMTRGIDEVLKMMPIELKEISLSLGANRIETATKVIFRQALPGILTAILIAFGRGIGDAASVLFTAGYTDRIPNSLLRPAASLPLAVFFQLSVPFPEVQQRAYASALILTIMVLVISILSRWFSRKMGKFIIK